MRWTDGDSPRGLPELYTLAGVTNLGHLENMRPGMIACPECGRDVRQYDSVDLVLDSWTECDLVAAAGGAYFVSGDLLARLQEVDVQGYQVRRVGVSVSDDFMRSHPQHVSKVRCH